MYLWAAYSMPHQLAVVNSRAGCLHRVDDVESINNYKTLTSYLMRPHQLSLLLLPILLSACATPQDLQPLQQRLDEIDNRIVSADAQLVEKMQSVCAMNLRQIENHLDDELQAKLKKELRAADKKIAAERERADRLEESCAAVAESDKIIVGEVEDVVFVDEDMTIEARVDSGAQTSSLGVFGLKEFERDGKDWVRFKLVNLKSAPAYEYRIRDDVKIKTRVEGLSDQRFEVRMDIRLGSKLYRRQIFNLANRRHFEYQALIGRSFLRDTAVVDVSKRHQLRRKK